MPSRTALIVAADQYDDPELNDLKSPAVDADALRRVLENPEIGDFEVDILLNEPEHVIRRRLHDFFDGRKRDDLLLLYFSCHGVKDEDDNRLYFAMPQTWKRRARSTGLSSDFVREQMDYSRSRRIVLMLDCCYSGAFAEGAKGDLSVDVGQLGGQGRVVLTASNSVQYSFDGKAVSGEVTPSVFTRAVVDGLSTGEADLDGDNVISVDELYEYVRDRVAEINPRQTPGKKIFEGYGELVLANSPRRAVEPKAVPADIAAALASADVTMRLGGVERTAELAGSADEGIALGARMALERLLDDDSRSISSAAGRALERTASHAPDDAVAPGSVEPDRESSQAAPDRVPALLPERRYSARGVDIDDLVNRLSQAYRADGLEVNVARIGDGTVIQARQASKLKPWLGMARALTVILQEEGGELRVRVGIGKWGDKAAVGFVALAAWPLLAIPAFGAVKQAQLRKRTFQIIELGGARRLHDS